MKRVLRTSVIGSVGLLLAFCRGVPAAADVKVPADYARLFEKYAEAAPVEKAKIATEIMATDPLSYRNWKSFANTFAVHSHVILTDYANPPDDLVLSKTCELLAAYCSDVRYKLDYDGLLWPCVNYRGDLWEKTKNVPAE